MKKEFYGVIDVTEPVKEKYTTKNKRGKDVVKTRTTYKNKSVLVKSGESTRVLAMQVLSSKAKELQGTLTATGTF